MCVKIACIIPLCDFRSPCAIFRGTLGDFRQNLLVTLRLRLTCQCAHSQSLSDKSDFSFAQKSKLTSLVTSLLPFITLLVFEFQFHFVIMPMTIGCALLSAVTGYFVTSLALLKFPRILQKKKQTVIRACHISHRGGMNLSLNIKFLIVFHLC